MEKETLLTTPSVSIPSRKGEAWLWEERREEKRKPEYSYECPQCAQPGLDSMTPEHGAFHRMGDKQV